MRTYILIIALLSCFLGQSQLINPSSVTVIGGNLMSSCEVSANTQSDLSSPSNSGKIVCVVGDISLNSDITLPSGMVLIDGGGSITFNSFSITADNTDLKLPYDRPFLIFNSTGGFSNNSTWKISDGFINVDAFGLVGDGNTDTGAGTDNVKSIQEALNIVNFGGWYAQISTPGTYMVTPGNSPDEGHVPTGLYLTGRGTTLELMGGVVLGGKVSAEVGRNIIILWVGKGLKLVGEGEVVGDLKYRTTFQYSNSNTSNIAVMGCISCEVGVRSSQSSGNTIYTKYNGVGFYYLNQVDETDFTSGFDLNVNTGAAESKSGHAYSIPWNMQSHKNKGYFGLDGGSFSGDLGLDSQQYYVVWYDNTAIPESTTQGFLAKSEFLETYQRVRIPSDAQYMRLVLLYNGPTFTMTQGTLAVRDYSLGTRITSPVLRRGLFQGISNLHPESIIDGVTFIEHGRTYETAGITPGQFEVGRDSMGYTGSPGYAIDIEDGYQALYGGKILNSIFKNNKGGDIIIKGPRRIEVAGNKFLYNDYVQFVRVKSVSLGNAEEALFHDNLVEDREFVIGRRSKAYDNIFKDSKITLYNEGVVFENNYLLDTWMVDIESGTTGYAFPDSTAIIKNNTFVFKKPSSAKWPGSLLKDIQNGEWIDNKFIGFKPIEYTHTQLANWGSITEGIHGYIDGMEIENMYNTPRTDGWQLPPMDINDLESSFSLDYRPGQVQRDFFLTNSIIYGNIRVQLLGYPTTGVNPNTFKTFKMENTHIKPPSGNYISTSSQALRADAVDVNIEVYGGSIDLTALGDDPKGDDFLNLDNLGWSKFIGTEFKTAYTSSPTISTTGSTSQVYFIDIDLDQNDDGVEDIALTLKPGDKRLFTKSHPQLEVYADNTAALAGGIPAGYLYRTSDGTVKTVFNE